MILREKNKKTQREIHQPQQRLTKQSAHFADCRRCPEMFLCFCLTFRHRAVMLHPCLLSFSQQLPLRFPPSLLPFFPQPPQNHLFFSNQVQHLEEEEVPETAFVLRVRTDFRRAEARLRAAAMIRSK